MKQISVAGLSQFLQSAHDEHHAGCRALGLDAALLLVNNPRFLAEVAQSFGDDFDENLTNIRHQRESAVVATLGPILFLV